CNDKKATPGQAPENVSSIGPADDHISPRDSTNEFPVVRKGPIIKGNVSPDSLVAFARTLIGVPYLYASTDPAKGFDCSGFITYVFNHFNIVVPRSSVDFTNYGTEITTEEARPGDLILFTGTDSTVRVVGHMGIIENVQEGQLHFIHSSSGKALGVVITSFERYYQSRFVKIIRVFPDELFR
ncbi:MAG: C40 family peptidase, partial [Bacteroidota bacterium]